MSDPKTPPDPAPTGGPHQTPPDGPGGDNGATAVQDDVEQLRRDRDLFRELLQRKTADFENYQKRNQRERDQERKYQHTPFARDLLPVIDNLERAIGAAKQAGETGPLVQGVSMVHGLLMDMLRRHNITRVDAAGQPFDPNLHQAVQQRPSDQHPAGTVLDVLEQGFMIHDRVLRPATVVVSVAS